ncbi:Nn.00g053980.m01.CDS01 [Neocucurbitaria sp. VM-36]
MPSRTTTDNATHLRKQGLEQEAHATKSAKSAESRANARKESKGLDKKDATDCTQHWEDAEHMEKNQAEYKKFQEENRRQQQQSASSEDNDDDDEGGKKRGRGANTSINPANKRQKTSSNGKGAHGDEPASTAGDKTRVPSQGQEVQWKEQTGVADGEAMEVVYEEKTVEGEKVEGSKEDPRVVVRSRGGDGKGNGEVSVKGPEEVFFN